MGNPADAEDLVQEVFLRVVRGWGGFAHRSSERTWLWAITHNCIKNFYRHQHRDPLARQRLELSCVGELPDRARPDETLRLALEQALQELSVAERQVFILRGIQDKTGAQAAEILGWSDAKVRVTLHRAMKKLQRVLSMDERIGGVWGSRDEPGAGNRPADGGDVHPRGGRWRAVTHHHVSA